MDRDDVSLTVGGAELIDRLELLWLSLLEHHSTVLPGFDYQPAEVSWAVRRRSYRHWLAEPGSFVVVAWAATNGPAAGNEPTREPIGYALVEVMDGPEDTWVSGDRLAELQTFAVAPAWRGRGIGTLLLDRVDAELAKLDIHDVLVAVLEGNSNARRLYERRGFRPVMTTLARFGTQNA